MPYQLRIVCLGYRGRDLSQSYTVVCIMAGDAYPEIFLHTLSNTCK